jgi:hypothetical protein
VKAVGRDLVRAPIFEKPAALEAPDDWPRQAIERIRWARAQAIGQHSQALVRIL